LDLTLDGAFDGLAHCLEVFYGASSANFERIKEIVEVGIELLVANLPKALIDKRDINSREALGLGTDLGGYAIMMGGTNGPHLNSFSLVDVLSHGRACGILIPYYTVFFSPAIQPQLKVLSQIFAKYGFIEGRASKLKGSALGEAVAAAMWKMARQVNFPISLREVNGLNQAHIEKALAAAKDPQLEMKLKNMPVPLSKEMVDNYMRPILEAAYKGNFSMIRAIKK
ncbi:MAG: iron-containing alcohol dehydrogenase, partial [Candidatus Aminicenantales bacterium]